MRKFGLALLCIVSVGLAAGPSLADHTDRAKIAIYYYDIGSPDVALSYRETAIAAGHKVRQADVLEVSSSEYFVPKTEVRYFFDRTRPLAEAVARDLGLGLDSLSPLDAAEFNVPASYDHSVEVWIAP